MGCDKVKMPEKSREKCELRSSDPICETHVFGLRWIEIVER